MIPRAAKQAGFAIARIMFDAKYPKSYTSMFEEIWDEIAAGHRTYGESDWTRFIRTRPQDTKYWYTRILRMALREIARKESYIEAKSAEIETQKIEDFRAAVRRGDYTTARD